jgi:hypothetical protein
MVMPLVDFKYAAIQTAMFLFIFKVGYLTTLSVFRQHSVFDRKIYELAGKTEILGENLPHHLTRDRTRPLLWQAGD